MHAKPRSALKRLGGAEAMQSTAGEELAQVPYVAATEGFERAPSGRKAPLPPLRHHDQRQQVRIYICIYIYIKLPKRTSHYTNVCVEVHLNIIFDLSVYN